MSNKIKKNIFKYISDSLSFVQIGLVFLAFFTIVYWILEIAGVKFIEPFTPFFEGIKNFIHIFYTRKVNTGTALVDFSFFIASILMLLCSWGLKTIIEYVEIVEEKYNKINLSLKRKAEADFNIQLEKEYLNQAYKENKFLALVKFNASNMTKDKFYNRDVDEGVEEKIKEILFDFFEIVDEDLNCKKSLIDGKVLLASEDFESIDKFLYSLDSILVELRNKYLAERWQLEFFVSMDVYSNSQEIELKTQKLASLIKLGLNNETVCFASFKERYELIKYKKYNLIGEGCYQILGESEEIFRIKSSK